MGAVIFNAYFSGFTSFDRHVFQLGQPEMKSGYLIDKTAQTSFIPSLNFQSEYRDDTRGTLLYRFVDSLGVQIEIGHLLCAYHVRYDGGRGMVYLVQGAWVGDTFLVSGHITGVPETSVDSAIPRDFNSFVGLTPLNSLPVPATLAEAQAVAQQPPPPGNLPDRQDHHEQQQAREKARILAQLCDSGQPFAT